MATNLAPIYLDNDRVTLSGDPKPNVEKIVRTAGKRPERVRVVRLNAQADPDGWPLAVNDVIDREANAETPVYLRSFEGQPGPTAQVGSKPHMRTGAVPPMPGQPTRVDGKERVQTDFEKDA